VSVGRHGGGYQRLLLRPMRLRQLRYELRLMLQHLRHLRLWRLL
jgi:hypothetical protein